MLRSLVGSEMCIRDSIQVVFNDQDSIAGINEGLQNLDEHMHIRGMQSNGCLLYTSDAADDLLCVDLGGRRIIKKKRTHDNKRTIIYSTLNILTSDLRYSFI